MAAVKAAKSASRWGVFAALRNALKNGATFAQFNIALTYEERRSERQRIRNGFAGYLA